MTRFPNELLTALDRAKMLGVRSGTSHPPTGVWVVVVERRVFVRSWNDAPTGWRRAFLAHPGGSLTVGAREVAARALPVRSARLRDDVSRAYAEKYSTKASEKWVRGLAEPERARTTLELVPA